MAERTRIDDIPERWMPFGIQWYWVLPKGEPKTGDDGKLGVEMTPDMLDKCLAAPGDMQRLLSEYDLLKMRYGEALAACEKAFSALQRVHRESGEGL